MKGGKYLNTRENTTMKKKSEGGGMRKKKCNSKLEVCLGVKQKKIIYEKRTYTPNKKVIFLNGRGEF